MVFKEIRLNKIFYFSPTGNARYVSEKLRESLGDSSWELKAIESIKGENLTPCDSIVLIYSIHGFNPPRSVKRFIKELPEGLSKRVHIIAVGCAESWINDAVSKDIIRVLEKKGYSIGVETTIAMPLTLIVSFPDNIVKDLLDKLDYRIEEIVSSIKEQREMKKSPGIGSWIFHTIGKMESPAARMFGLELHSNRRCTSCGTCIKRCPEKNIRFNKKGKLRFSFRCIMCLRCIYECPEKAISPRFSKFIPIKNGYNLRKFLE